ncbi:AraC family transcriptional regulator [Actinoplanes philippinensis]|uniref:Helix-turn-helix domain-containing protein n=1 Tax=Actinoplanes philippinensis TaxID=35752 RepID=A0A1I2A047_9ACTN|nr:helix-turn-helix domain-containing protein [Actinoplanes philippinensis]GIE75173.1 AraC family transcriptional regulator [Actinoplanes philippinensis]SFE37332.1 Helix-turn-helix domain-containing protein [Actinoplanes philippinensis]
MQWSGVDVAMPGFRLPGIDMAGFRQRSPAFWDLGMVAHPSVTLLIDLSDGAGAAYETPAGRQHGSVMAGLLPGPVRATGWGRVECLQIRLAPAVAAALYGGFADLSTTVAPLSEIWGRHLGRIEDGLRAARSWDERFTIAAAALTPRRSVAPEIARAWELTVAGRGRVRVADLAGEVGWSRQRLWSRFRAEVGVTPKVAARLSRFDHAAHLLAAGRPAAVVATESGFADQSHLHRETRRFAGMTPAAVAASPWLAIDHRAWPRSSP